MKIKNIQLHNLTHIFLLEKVCISYKILDQIINLNPKLKGIAFTIFRKNITDILIYFSKVYQNIECINIKLIHLDLNDIRKILLEIIVKCPKLTHLTITLDSKYKNIYKAL